MSSAGQVAGYVVGGVVGSFFGNPIIGAQIGGMIGGYIDPPKGQNTVGPRLEDLTVQTSTYGAVIPRLKGTIAVTGNVFWLEGDKLNEITNTKKVGGKGGPTAKQTTFSYTATFAVGLSHQISAPIGGIRRLWLANTLVYDAGSGDINSVIASNQQAGILFKFYDGRDDQQPDPRMQADKGINNVSGYPGRCYIVFYDLDLTEKYNNTLMATQVKVELVSSGGAINTSSVVDSIFTGNLGDPTWGNSIALLGVNFTPAGATYVTYEKNNYGGAPQLMNFGRMEFPYLDTAASDNIVSPEGGYGYAWSFPRICQSDEDLSLQTQAASIALDICLRWFSPGGSERWSDYLNDSRMQYGDHFSVVFDRGETFLAGDNPTAYIVKVDRVGSVVAASSIKYCVRQFGVSENYVFALLFTIGSDNPTTTVYKFDRLTLALLDTYTQTAIGGRGTIQVVDDDTFYTAGWRSGFGGHLYKWENGVVVDDFGDIFPGGVGDLSRLHVVSDAPLYGYLLHHISGANTPSISAFYLNVPASVAHLHDIVTDECALAGISSSDLDLSELVNSDVRGYRVSHAGSVRAVLEQLQAAFPFDVIQSGYKLKFKSRGSASVLTVPESDLGAHSSGDVPTRFMLTTEMPSQIPAKVTFNFLNADREYDPDEQSATFTAQDVKNSYTVSLPLVMTPTEALQAADVLLKKEWRERSTAGTFWLPPTDDYRKLEAADVIDVVSQSRTHTLRLTKVTQLPDGRIECDGKLTASAAYASAAQAQNSLALGQSLVPLTGSSELLLLDIPRIVSEQDVPGISLGMYGYTSDWNGGVAFRSDDFGESYNAILALPEKTEVFRVLVTPALVPHYGIDHVTALIVSPEWVGADLFSITKIQLYALGNLAAYGAPGRWEIVCFKTVVDNGDGTYTLRDFLRGRFGSDWAMTLHEVEDRLVMLDPDRVDFAGLPLTNLGAERLWRGVTSGASIDSTQDKVNTYSGNNLMPLSPVCLRGWRNTTTFDYYIEATRRSRWPTELFSGLETPLGESSEQYEAEIWDVDFTSRKRVFSGLSSPSITWTQAQQLADFGYEASDVGVKLRQVSSVVGGGRWLQSPISRVLLDDPYIDSVVLLLHMDDVALSDVKGHTVSIDGSVSRSSVQSKFGGYSALFAAGGRLRIPYTTDLAFGAGDFTIEMFVYVSSYNGSLSRFWSPNAALYDGISFGIDSSGHLYCYCSSNNSSWDLVAATNIVTVTTGAFKWIVFQRRGPNLDCYYEGTRYSVSTSLGTTSLMTQSTVDHAIGGFVTSDNSLYGYGDEVRVTKTARYTGDTIPIPSLPFNNP